MATEPYFALSDGSTTCTFADGVAGATNFKIAYDTWALGIATPRTDALGGRGPYSDVVEEMRVIVSGSSAAHCLANLRTLTLLLEQADRWARGEWEGRVYAQYSPKGGTVSSAASPLKAVVLGKIPGDSSALHLPTNFDGPILGNSDYILNARLRFVRRGLWLHNQSAAASSAGAETNESASLAVTGTAVPCPISLTVSNFRVNYPAYLVAAGDASTNLVLLDAEGAASGVYTAVADSANNARGGSVLRYTPAGTSEISSAFLSTGAFAGIAAHKQFAVLAHVRNNSAAASYYLRLGFRVTTTDPTYYTPIQVIAASAGSPSQWLHMGILRLQSAPSRVAVLAQATAASGSLDVDTLCLVSLGNERTQILYLQSQESSGALDTIRVEHNLLDPNIQGQAPVVLNDTTSTPMTYKGDPVLTTKSNLYCALLASDGASPQNWRAAAGSPHVFTGLLRAAYVTPE